MTLLTNLNPFNNPDPFYNLELTSGGYKSCSGPVPTSLIFEIKLFLNRIGSIKKLIIRHRPKVQLSTHPYHAIVPCYQAIIASYQVIVLQTQAIAQLLSDNFSKAQNNQAKIGSLLSVTAKNFQNRVYFFAKLILIVGQTVLSEMTIRKL